MLSTLNAAALIGIDAIRVTVETNVAAAQEAFRNKFPTDRTLTPSLLVVNPRQ